MLSSITRDFSPQAICRLICQLTQTVACFWILLQGSQTEQTAVCKAGLFFLQTCCYLSPNIFFYVKCLCDCKLQEGLRGSRGRRAPRHNLILHFIAYYLSCSQESQNHWEKQQEKLQLWAGCMNYFTHHIPQMQTIFPCPC